MALDFILYTILLYAKMFMNGSWFYVFNTFLDGLNTTQKSDKLQRTERVKAMELQINTNEARV